MRNYAIQMKGADLDPVSSGSMQSWFFYYKWRPDEEDEVFVPVGKDDLEGVEPSDMLWFFMDGRLVGRAVVSRVEWDYVNARKEVWYHTTSCQEAKQYVESTAPTGELSQDMAELFCIAFTETDASAAQG